MLTELRLLNNIDVPGLNTIEVYERLGGYKAMRKALTELTEDQVLNELEESGLRDPAEGKRGNPRLKPPFPANQGLYQGPTLINNVETLMNVPDIIWRGADWFKEVGSEKSTGTKVVSVSGNVRRPGNYEIELGMRSGDI